MQRKVIFFLIVLLISTGWSQQYEYHHPELKWETFDTDHFTVHFHQGTRQTAFIVAKIAEDIYPHITGLYNYRPKGKIHFIIKDTDDYSNGGAFFFDDKVEIWASNLDYVMRGTKNWLRDVVTHEFTHMISIQKAVKTNTLFPYGFFQVFGYENERRKDVVRGFPNTIVSYPISSINIPVWFAEGVAQYQADSSRYDYRDPHREMIVRDRILNDKLLTYNEMTVFGKNSHGNESSYNLGFSFVNYLTDRFDEKILEKITEISSRWNSYTFEGVIRKATGVQVEILYSDWKDSLQTVYEQRTEEIRKNLVRGRAIEKEGFSNLYPAWSPDGSKIAYLSNAGEDYFGENRLVLYDRKTGSKKNITGLVSSSLSWSPDGKYLAYARQIRGKNESSFYDLFLFDIQENKEIRLTKGLRGTNPDFSHDGKRIVFVTSTNGLNQLNIYDLPESFDRNDEQVIYADMETGRMVPEKTNKTGLREIRMVGGKIQQVLVFEDNRQIYHPRWSNDDSEIIFDTAIGYGRNLGVYDLNKKSFNIFMDAPEEIRYPVFKPNSPWLYYSASTSGIYNIYRYNPESGKKEQLTNVTGGAFMPSVNAEGDIVYACYDSLGYHIYEIQNPMPVPSEKAVYDNHYSAMIPAKNFDDSTYPEYEVKPYKRKFSGIHILPRVLIDYKTIKPGFYVVSSDVLQKTNFIGGAAVNSDLDYDLYAYFELKELLSSLFFEVYNSTANIEDTLSIRRGESSYLSFKRNVNFNLTEARVGINARLMGLLDSKAAFVYRYYNANLDPASAYSENEGWVYIPTIRYNYLKGWALEWSVFADMVHPGKDEEINPSGGRYFFLKHSYQSNDFLEGFSTDRSLGLEEYRNYTFNQIEMDWEEFFKNPFLAGHAFSLRLRGGYIDRSVDSFFNLFAGGLIGMKGYSYYSLEGRKKLIGTATYRFPVLSHIDKRIGHLYLDKVYFGMFYDFGNAWNEDEIKFEKFKRDVGFQLRLDSFSYYLFPTRFFAEAVYPLDKVTNNDTLYDKEWRFYFGALFEFDIRERFGGLFRTSKSGSDRRF
ncbi:MAG: hypothetical protein AB7W47_06800 [Calditrichaceae bacterium]